MKRIKVIIEKHPDGYVAYPLGLKGVCVAEGDTYEMALTEVQSAIRFHMETFGQEALADEDSPVLKASTLRTICTQAGIARDDFLRAFEET